MDEAKTVPAPKKNSPLKYILLAVSLIIIGAVVFSLGVFSPNSTPKKNQPTVTSGPKPTAFAHTVLSFMPNPISMDGATGSVEIMVDPRTNPVTAVQLEISYDPKVLTNVVVESEKTFFTAPLVLINKSDKAAGHITYALGITPAQQPVTTPGNVVKITFSKVPGTTATQTTLKLDPETLVAASGIGPSVLETSSDLIINF